MSVITQIIEGLAKYGVVSEFFNNGGGVAVVRVVFGGWVEDESINRFEVIITERDDSFEMYDDDDDMAGLMATLAEYGDDGEYVSWCDRKGHTLLYQTDDVFVSVNDARDNGESMPPGAFLVDMRAEIRACVDVVAFAVQKVEEAWTGRGPGDGPEARRQAMLG